MTILKIGEFTIYYVGKKDLIYKIVKLFYFKDKNVKLFDGVRCKNDEDKKESIYVDLLKAEGDFYFKTGKETHQEWTNIVNKLKEQYSTEKNESLVIQENNSDDEKIIREKFLQTFKKKVTPDSITGRLIHFNNIDENGFSNGVVYYEDIIKHPDYIKDRDNVINGGNGISWKRTVEKYLKIQIIKNKGKSIGYSFKGFNFEHKNKNRNIRRDIRKILENCRCSHCGKKGGIEIDHKNGRYNDIDVLNLDSQNIDHFQPLCDKCNKHKRSSCKKCKENGIRYDATFNGFTISVIEGTLMYDNDIGCNGCYWYDCHKFKSSLFLKN